MLYGREWARWEKKYLTLALSWALGSVDSVLSRIRVRILFVLLRVHLFSFIAVSRSSPPFIFSVVLFFSAFAYVRACVCVWLR